MNRQAVFLLLISICLSLVACDTESNYAPVTEINTIEPIPKTGIYRATRDESLYKTAWRYGLDYRELAVRNQIKSPYRVQPGQVIYLRKKPSMTPQGTKNRTHVQVVDTSHSDLPITSWRWPARGKVVRPFSTVNKGINMAGIQGDPIYATAAGKVVYCGDGLRGYGNLIIIKHNNLYLSAYAHNKTITVKEGEVVKQGQKIAEMGSTGSNKTMLHFEIRRAGKPIDPASLLSS